MTSVPSVSYSIIVRCEVPAGTTAVSALAGIVERAGGLVTALDVSGSAHDHVQVDVTIAASSTAHAAQVVQALEAAAEITVRKVSDRTFLLHLGGKLEVRSKVPIRNRDDLSMAYTPGVARICMALVEHPEDARRLTIKRNTVAVVTDGSAVLGLGNLGALAALPVMEGKAALFKRFADIDAFPICLDTQETEEIIRTVQAIAPVFAGINLEDIASPRCFEIEERLRDLLDIPVFHDDQHGTAIVVLAALRNALKVVGKELPDLRIVMSGAGAAGRAIAHLLLAAGATDLVAADRKGAISAARTDLRDPSRWFVDHVNPRGISGTLREVLSGADVFIGVSGPGLLTGDDIATMAPGAIVFALANPDPEVEPEAAALTAAVVATGRSDYPNQINNVLAFPGVFRGLLDAHSTDVNTPMLLAAADALAGTVSDDERNAAYIVPSVFHPGVAEAVADAVRRSVESARLAAAASQGPAGT